MTRDLPRLRSLLGESAALWSGPAGVRVEPGRWVALSGARSVDYNVALCHGASGHDVARSVEEITAAGAPGLVMVAGPALGGVQRLVEAGWVCVGSAPFMTRPLDPADAPDQTHMRDRCLKATEFDAARELVSAVFGIGPELALIAVPDAALAVPGRTAWGTWDEAGALVACLVTVAVEETVAVWSMATAAHARRRGHGARLLELALATAAAKGAERSLLHASPDGEPFYERLGYEELERWQLWSRPRWVLGRA